MSDYGFGAVPNELLDRKDARIAALEAELAELRSRVAPIDGDWMTIGEWAGIMETTEE